MSLELPSLAAAFAAGLLSFLSPCVLPLVPGYLSFITGRSVSSIKQGQAGKPLVLFRTLFFVLGFALVFVVLGFAFSGAFALGGARRTLGAIAGLVVIAFGLNTIFEFAKFLEIEKRFHPAPGKGGAAGAFLLGLAFAAGWSPCIGPILGSILLYAGRSGSGAQAGALLGAYTLGLALPFLAAGLAFERLKPLLDWFRRHGLAVRVVSGLLLIGIGIAMLSGRLAAFNGILARSGWALQGFAASDSGAAYAAALAAYGILAALVAAIPILRKRPFIRPWRLVLLGLLALLALGEVLAWWHGIEVLGGWLLFQGF